ncbi:MULTISPECIES: amidohydrolase family protein [Actinomadura]|uniref:Amidohydrolase family protein n=2 Tax=Actinomadura yumaensis TaxID=111807 RepID=A0ABW2CLU0_9ACTN|nr:amidohydrolase family protein [Actinomadura sp. J1-007]MWK36603.1 amidohydrolase family protein [Actinomadura sp. J1-007]
MLIDVHGHVSAPDKLYSYKANLLSHRGAHGRGGPRISDDELRAAQDAPNPSFGNASHMDHLDGAGVDLQLISPRPYQMMHSETGRLVQWFTEETNTVIHRLCELYPERYKGVAGLPQSPELDVQEWTAELRRTVTELGFAGCLLNPDPHEGTAVPPALGDRYWYPLYEALCELDVPAIIHGAGCRPPTREPYSLHFIQEETVAIWSLLSSSVLTDFPDLKIVVSHGGGAIPYQVGRFLPADVRGSNRPYMERLRSLWFDTCLYTQDSIELLLRTVGVDRALFGTEKPGTGSQRDPRTGRWFDDIHLLIGDIDWLTPTEREQIFAENARKLFKL